MVRHEFVDWVIMRVKYSQKTASDAASRCRRVERLFNVKLDSAVRTQKGFEAICQRLKKEINSYVKPKGDKRVAKATLTRAVKLYHEFLNSK